MNQPITFIAYSPDPASFIEVRDALLVGGRTRLLAGCDRAEQVYAEMVRLEPMAAVVILGADPEPELNLLGRLAAAYPDTALIAAARQPTPELVMRSIRAGAREFIPLPLNSDELRTAVDRVAEFCAARDIGRKKRGRVVATFSSKGGCGASFLAANLAAAAEVPTLLMDLNLQAGDLSLFLDVQPRFSILNLIENRLRLDDTLLGTFVQRHPSMPRLSFVGAPRDAEQAEKVAEALAPARGGGEEQKVDVEHALSIPIVEIINRFLRPRFQFIVLDLPHTFDEITLDVLNEADDILVVLNSGIPAITSVRRTLDLFDRLGYPRHKVRIVANRWNKKFDLDLQKEVESAHGERILGYIPSDYPKVMESINLGRPLVHLHPSIKASAEIRRLAALLARSHDELPQAPARKGLLGLFQHSTPETEGAIN
jgi:pilus assembly protein CpaE